MLVFYSKTMILNCFLTAILLISTLFAALCGSPETAGSAAINGANAAVGFVIELTGAVCLWSAVMELLERSGVTGFISRLLAPLLRRLFPAASRDEGIMAALSENVSANLLGLGNAATPAGIRAAKGMARLDDRRAENELCLLVVLNTASIQLVPSTIAAVRAANGAASAFDIMPAVWISSAISLAAGLTAAKLLSEKGR